jgi:hypothetical protein
MFIGHFAVALGAKRYAPQTSLAMLVAAAQLADLLWPVFLALGLEHVRFDPGASPFLRLDFVDYPYSHSLFALIVWGLMLGGVYRVFTRTTRALWVIALLVVSHWVLDVATHTPDMPIYPGSVTVGLGLWKSVPATLIVETILYAVGVWIYVRTTRARDAIGRWAFAALVVFLIVAYVASLGSLPPSLQALYFSALAGAAVLVLWCWWADDHRAPVAAPKLRTGSRVP